MNGWADVVERVRWQDALDIVILTLVAFRVFLFLRGTVALQVLMGMGALLLAAAVASEAELVLTTYLLQTLGAVAVVAVVVVFQDEIRRALRRVDPMHLWRWRRARGAPEAGEKYRTLAQALVSLARQRTGALVVLRRADAVEEHMSGGLDLQALLSTELLESIFQNTSPIHDGAAIVKGSRIESAGAILPLSRSTAMADRQGTRHRAALGLSEVCDAVVLVVSEERGEISCAVKGSLKKAPGDLESLAGFIDALMRASDDRGGTLAVPTQRPPRRLLGNLLVLVAIFLLVAGSWYAVAFHRSTVISVQRPIELRGAPSKGDVELIMPGAGEVMVNLRGPRNLLYSRVASEVVVWVSAENLERGRNRLEIRSSAPAGIEVVSIEPDHAILRLRPAEADAESGK